MDVAPYQRFVNTVWELQRKNVAPIRFIYNQDNKLFILLSSECARKSDHAIKIQSALMKSNDYQWMKVVVAEGEEERSVAGTLREQFGAK
jgi:hypothetical protein